MRNVTGMARFAQRAFIERRLPASEVRGAVEPARAVLERELVAMEGQLDQRARLSERGGLLHRVAFGVHNLRLLYEIAKSRV